MRSGRDNTFLLPNSGQILRTSPLLSPSRFHCSLPIKESLLFFREKLHSSYLYAKEILSDTERKNNPLSSPSVTQSLT